jgi:hypothetical protein
MRELLEKFIELERLISAEKGNFRLFALFLREDAPNKWDLVVAAPWMDSNQGAALRLIDSKLQKSFAVGEILKLSKIVIIESGSPLLSSLNRAIRVLHGCVEVKDSDFFGLEIKHAYIITSEEFDSGAGSRAVNQD